MKSATNEDKKSDAERGEKAKKLYRYVNDVARRIDEATAACRSVADLFTTHNEVQRQKLKDNCEKLMFIDPTNYGKKSLELLWRKVYYDCISAAKKFRETDNDYENYTFTHIVMGIGHFHSLITRVQSEYMICMKDVDYSFMFEDDLDNNKRQVNQEHDEFAQSMLHSCLVYLGDLTRYQTEMSCNFDSSIAARYYLQAAQINMSSGMPYNQLGNLYVDKNYNIDSVCYYIHCLSCSDPFEGAMGNLNKLFEKNTEYCVALENTDALTQNEHIHATVSNFLSLIEIWYLDKKDDEIPQRCNQIAHQLKESINFKQTPLPNFASNLEDYNQAVEGESHSPSYLNNDIIYRMVQICLFTVAKMSEIDEKKAFACKAFTLALLSQLLQKQMQDLLSFGLKNPADKFRKHSVTVEERVSEIEIIEKNENHIETVKQLENGFKEDAKEDTVAPNNAVEEKPQNGTSKSLAKKAAKRRRRRRVAGSDSSDESDLDSSSSNSESENSMSDSEDSGESSFDSDNKSDISTDDESLDKAEHNGDVGNGTDNNSPDLIKANGQPKENGLQNEKNTTTKVASELKPELKVDEIQKFLQGNNILPSLKLLQDWALNEKDLILSCGESGEVLFQSVVDLLNMFTLYFKPSKITPICDVLKYACRLAKNLELEYKMIPLPEDISLRGTNICKFDKDAAEWQTLNKFKPSVYEENMIRILNFIDFANQIANIVPRIRMNRSMQIFYIKKAPAPKLSAKIHSKGTREWHNSKLKASEVSEGDILHRLGRQYLSSRVRDLERHRTPTAPTLLAIDAAALNKHLKKVKHLCKTGTFVVLVPSVVLQELDDVKRSDVGARVAIRWLEAQLQRGSRVVRAQRPRETRAIPLLKPPRKAPPHILNYIQILEYCHHFVADEKPQGGNGDPDNTQQGKLPLLVLLTGAEPGAADEYKEFSVTGAAQAAGVTVEFIGTFYSKWRQTAHKSGKKR